MRSNSTVSYGNKNLINSSNGFMFSMNSRYYLISDRILNKNYWNNTLSIECRVISQAKEDMDLWRHDLLVCDSDANKPFVKWFRAFFQESLQKTVNKQLLYFLIRAEYWSRGAYVEICQVFNRKLHFWS